MAANSAQIMNLLMPGLYKVSGQYERYNKEWSNIFTTVKSTLQTETAVQMRILGPAQMKVEGGATAFDNNMGQRFRWNATAFEAALGYAITLRAVEDNQYTSDFNMMNLRLVDSFAQFKEVQGANILNNGQTYDPQVGGDGVALFSTAHPYDLGTWANTFSTQLDLNESSLLQAFINIGSTFVDEAGLRITASGERLIVPPALEPVALRLINAELRPGTANNDPNVIPMLSSGAGKKPPMVYHYLTSNYAWFVKTDKPGLHYFDRIAYDSDMWVDNATDNIMTKGRERYTFSYRDPRAMWGSFPTA
jgi:hypothetical protein